MKILLSTLAHIAKSRRSLGLLLLGILIAVRISDPAPLEELRLRSFDLFQSIHPRDTKARPAAIVDIDEASLSAYGQFPWPRTLVADMLTRLFELNAVAVGFDVIFAERDRTSPAEAMKHFRDLDEAARQHLLQLPSNDDVFAKAIARGKVVLGQSGTRTENTRAADTVPATAVATLGQDPRPYLIEFPKLLRNLPVLERAAAGRGLFSIVTEKDGMVRRVPLVMSADDELVPALAVELLRVASGAQTVLVRSDASGVQSVAMPGLDLPTDQNGRVWVHFSRHDPLKYISAKDLIEGKVPAEKVSGKIVLIGTSAIGLLDLKTTPVDSAMPGVEVHAQLVEAALANSLLKAPSLTIVYEILSATLAALLLLLLAPIVNAIVLFATAVLVGSAFAGASWILYGQYQTLFDPTFPLITTVTIYMGLALVGYFQEEADRQRIRGMFAQYLSPSVVEQLARSPEKIKLGGEVRTLTILFSDVRGFTAVSETFANDPEGLTTLMNRLLTPLTNVIATAHNGTIDKYMGDAVMAFWNAPIGNPLHERDACCAALDMINAVNQLNMERERESQGSGIAFVPIRIGVGINTGQCVVGNMGSELRVQYTAMGDSVNLASRLEGQTATYKVPIIIGSTTAEAVAADFALIEADVVRVKGKSRPEVVYALIGKTEVAESLEFKQLKGQWSDLLLRYRKQDWAGVSELADRCRDLCTKFGLDGLANLYRDRSRQFSSAPPPADWDGVYSAEFK